MSILKREASRPSRPHDTRIKRIARALRVWLANPSIPMWCAVLGVLLTSPSLFTGIHADDHHLRMVVEGAPGLPDFGATRLDVFTFADGIPAHNQLRTDRGLLPWWASDNSAVHFFRPLSAVTHYIDFTFFGTAWWFMHAESLFWYGLLCAIVAMLYRRLIPVPWIAGLAAVFFAVDDAHGIPAGWLADRNAVLSALAGALVLICHDRWRHDGRISNALFASLFLLLGLLCGEAAIATVGYLAAYALFLDKAPIERRIASLLPYGLVTVAFLAFYIKRGFGAHHSGIYDSPFENFGRFAESCLARLPVLLHAQLGIVSSNPYVMMTATAQKVTIVASIAILIAFSVVLWPLLRRSSVAQFFAVGMVMAAVPATLTLPADRLLCLAGIGGMGLVAVFIAQATDPKVSLGSDMRNRIGKMVAVGLIGIHGIFSPLGLPFGSVSVTVLGAVFERTLDKLEINADSADKSIIMINAPFDVFCLTVPVTLSERKDVLPKHIWPLTVGMDPLDVTRVDAHQLDVRCEKGFFPYPYGVAFLDPATDFNVGDRYETTDFTATILEVSEDDHPLTFRFDFKKDLTSTAYRWFCIKDFRCVPFEMPAIGESVHFPAVDHAAMVQFLVKDIVLGRAAPSVHS